jgi:hypothetical protein
MKEGPMRHHFLIMTLLFFSLPISLFALESVRNQSISTQKAEPDQKRNHREKDANQPVSLFSGSDWNGWTFDKSSWVVENGILKNITPGTDNNFLKWNTPFPVEPFTFEIRMRVVDCSNEFPRLRIFLSADKSLYMGNEGFAYKYGIYGDALTKVRQVGESAYSLKQWHTLRLTVDEKNNVSFFMDGAMACTGVLTKRNDFDVILNAGDGWSSGHVEIASMTYERLAPATRISSSTTNHMSQMVGHTDIAKVKFLSETKMSAIKKQKWFFTHASVGGNMIEGMNDLHKGDPARYPLVVCSVGFNNDLQRADNPPTATAEGTIYECNRGNPGWQGKIDIFDNSVRAGGWRNDAVDVIMDKFCYIDQNADVKSYLNKMSHLEKSYPDTRIIYTTMPLTTAADADNVLRNKYNDAVRKFCKKNKKTLFDIADMEAYSPGGESSTFTKDGKTYQKLFSGYTGDGGHLNELGRKRIATGWYALASRLPSKKK